MDQILRSEWQTNRKRSHGGSLWYEVRQRWYGRFLKLWNDASFLQTFVQDSMNAAKRHPISVLDNFDGSMTMRANEVWRSLIMTFSFLQTTDDSRLDYSFIFFTKRSESLDFQKIQFLVSIIGVGHCAKFDGDDGEKNFREIESWNSVPFLDANCRYSWLDCEFLYIFVFFRVRLKTQNILVIHFYCSEDM